VGEEGRVGLLGWGGDGGAFYVFASGEETGGGLVETCDIFRGEEDVNSDMGWREKRGREMSAIRARDCGVKSKLDKKRPPPFGEKERD